MDETLIVRDTQVVPLVEVPHKRAVSVESRSRTNIAAGAADRTPPSFSPVDTRRGSRIRRSIRQGAGRAAALLRLRPPYEEDTLGVPGVRAF